MNKSAVFRATLSGIFVLFMLAAAHLFMVVINAAEHAVDPAVPSKGMEARLFTDRPLIEELEGALARTRSPEDKRVLEDSLASARAGEPVQLRTLPVTRFIVAAALALTALGGLLLWATSRLKGDAAQSIVGIFGGNLMWTGAIEYGLTIASRSLGIGKNVAVVDGQTIAIYGEYVLLKHTWGALVIITAYLLFLESSRCPIFLWWRKKVPTMRGPIVTGRIDNYGPRTAFQYATTVWFFYLLLLWAYDEQVAGVYSVATKAIMLLSLAGTIYYVNRLYHQTGWGTSVRYAVGAMVVAWTPVEIAGKWGWFAQPWLLLHPEPLIVFFGGLGLGTWGLWRAQKRRLNEAAQALGRADDEAQLPQDDSIAARPSGHLQPNVLKQGGSRLFPRAAA